MQKYFVSYIWKTTLDKGYGHTVVEVENGVHGVALLEALIKGLEQSRKGCVIMNFIKLE